MGLRWKQGRFISSFLSFRGFVSPLEADAAVVKMRETYSFLEWLPDSFLHHQSDAGAHAATSATLVANTTAVKRVLGKTVDRFDKMLKRKAFLHTFLQEGLEEQLFAEARENVRDLMDEYEQMHSQQEDEKGDFF